MAVPSSREAIAALRKILDGEDKAERALLRETYLPPGYEAEDPTGGGRGWVWSDPPPGEVGGYRLGGSYRLAPPDSVIWRPPGEVFTAPASGAWSDQDRQTYRQHSVDLTMRGGTTSGVVYPLAVCEIARKRRIRSVGGASAGAIAAAATAAAELGRSSHLSDEQVGELSDEEAAAGKVRAGFVGLADTVAWLCQVGPHHQARDHDQYRLAQLFRPVPAQRRLFAIATAVMRRQLWAVPMVALLAFGWVSKLLLLALAAGALVLTAVLAQRLPTWPAMDRPAGGPDWYDPSSLGWAALDLGLFFVVIAGALVVLPVLRAPAAGRATPPWLKLFANVSSAYAQADRGRSLLGRVVAIGVLFVGPLVVAGRGWWHWPAGTLVGIAVSALIAVVVGASVWRYQAQARSFGFGVIAGAAPAIRRRSPSEWLAGAAKPTIKPSLMPWLSQSLTQLAGLSDGQPLLFGHLWLGRDYTPRPAQPRPRLTTEDPTTEDGQWRAANETWLQHTADVRDMSINGRRRLVNLELITTDLTRQRPYRFPLDWADVADPEAEQLYYDPDDLRGATSGAAYFDEGTIAAMADPEPQPFVLPDGRPINLHRVPDPWNLPVAFALRLSCALPALFKAVRLYRVITPTRVRDDLGRPIRSVADNRRLWWPPGTARPEELWFSDGGITSNFPVHLFDAPLPGWPTFGLNLGTHPDGHPHQDVWLPQDWQATRSPATEVRPAATAFLGAIVTTARSWRDTMQTGMPGYRGRVAWVRQRPDEGGTNLYMPREVIASLALRGALAGARLSRRFGNTTQVERYRWLRLRIALDNLQRLREDVTAGRPVYDQILASGDALLDELEHRYEYDPFSEGITWYRPEDPSFWTMAQELLDTVATPPGDRGRGDTLLTRGGPVPHPALSQIPPM